MTIDKIKVNWVGSQHINHSFALVNREICKRLIGQKEFEIGIVPFEHDDNYVPEYDFKLIYERYVKKDHYSDITIRHQWPPDFERPNDSKWVIMQPWEFGALPRKWYIPMKYWVDQVWVFSHYNKECYIRSGIPESKIKVIPHGVNSKTFHYNVKPLSIKTSKTFKFLFVGGTIFRKGIDLLLESYLEEFSSEDDVCLVIKDNGKNSSYKGQTFDEFIKEAQKNPNNPEIVYIDQELTPNELAGLYKSCNCLVHPYRGEGFGLPIIEAMACGTPPIVPSLGPVKDFCTDETAFFVASKEKKLNQKNIGNLPTVELPWLIDVDINELKKTMRYVFNNTSILEKMGSMASKDIQSKYTWEQSATLYNQNIQQLLLSKEPNLSDDVIISLETKKGIDLYEKGLLFEALDVFYSILDAYPDDIDSRYNVAIVLFKMMEITKALKEIQHIYIAMEDKPKEFRAEINNLMGLCYVNLKEYSKALSLFRESLKLDPTNKNVIENIELITQELKQFLPNAWELISEFDVDKFTLSSLSHLSNMEYEEIFYFIKDMGEREPITIEDLYKLGMLYLLKGNYEQAIICLQKCIDFNIILENKKVESRIYKHLGIAYQKLGNNFRAEELYTFSLEIYPEDQETLEYLYQVKNSNLFIKQKLRNPAKNVKDLNELYHRIAHKFEGDDRVIRQLRSKWLRYFLPGEKVLDIGCGNGLFMEMLSEVGVKTEGIDFDEVKVKQARIKGLKVYQQRAEEFLVDKEGYYNGIVLGHIIEHIAPKELLELLIKCTNALAVDGKMLIITPDIKNPLVLENFWLDITHVRPYPKLLTQIVMESLGLEVKEVGLSENNSMDYYIFAQKNTYEIKWQSPIFDCSGYADENIQYLDALRPYPVKIKLEPREGMMKPDLLNSELRGYLSNLQGNILESSLIHFQSGPAWHFAFPNAPISIGRTMFETDKLNKDWVSKLNEFTEVWVPSEFNRTTFIANGVDSKRIFIIPGSINVEKYNPQKVIPLPIDNHQSFKFLSIFDWCSRKGWDILIKAFLQEFNNDDVVLILKVTKSLHPDADPHQEILNISKDLGLKKSPRIKIIENFMSEEEIIRLYASVDAFVLPSRGEGWGRPYMEAMAMGLPTIGTRWSGQQEFMNDDNSYLIDIDGLIPVDNSMPEFFFGHNWAQPSEVHLKKLMRFVYENHEVSKMKGNRARNDIITKYSNKEIGRKIYQRLEELVMSYYG